MKYVHYIALFLLLLIVAVFLQLCFQSFTQPYFWDELGVYAPASIHLYENGIGLLPANLPDVLSRGHPTLFVVIVSIAFKLFACTPLVAHITCYLIYVVGVLYLFKILGHFLNHNLALLFTIAIALQPCFISQSIIVLPEVCLMSFTLASVYYFIKEKFVWCCLFLCLYILVKESALILPMAFYLTQYIHNRKFRLKIFALLWIVPYGLFGLFLCIQKIQNGWFLFPLHTGLMKLEMYYIKERWHFVKLFLFKEQWRYWLMLLFCIILVALLIYYRKKIITLLKPQFKILSLIILLIFGGIIFSVINYYLNRYTLYYLVFVYLFIVLVLNCFSALRSFYILPTIALLLICNTFYSAITPPQKYSDTDFSYVSFVKTSESTFQYLSEKKFETKKIAMDFPLIACVWRDKNGYKTLAKKPIQIPSAIDTSINYYVFSEPGNYWKFKDYDTTKLALDTTIINKYSFVKFYKVSKIKY